MVKYSAVYILTSQKNGTLYIGVTGHLLQRIWQHRNELVPSFTQKYRIHQLVYYEIHEDITQAILREKQLKKWKRQWKLKLIAEFNPEWIDLWEDISDW